MNEEELFRKYRETGDVTLRNQIVEKYLYIASVLAKKFVGRGVDYDDLYQVASLALIRGVDRLDERKGLKFSTFITPSESRRFSYIRKASRSDIRREEIPGAEEIIERKKERIKEAVLDALSAEPRQEYLEIAESVLTGRDSTEAFALLLSSIYKDELDASRYREIAAPMPRQARERSRKEKRDESMGRRGYDRGHEASMDEGGTTRLFIARGRKDGLTKAMLINILIDQAGVRDEDIRDVEINDTSSFVSAPFSVAQAILKAYSDRTMKGKPIVMRAKPEGGARDARKKAPGRREAFKGRGKRRRRWEDDYQPYGRDTRDGEDGRYSFPERGSRQRKRRK